MAKGMTDATMVPDLHDATLESIDLHWKTGELSLRIHTGDAAGRCRPRRRTGLPPQPATDVRTTAMSWGIEETRNAR